MTVVGVVCALAPDNVIATHRAYIDAVAGVGGTPILIPATLDPDRAMRLVEGIDALLLLSGGDIHPQRYGEPVRATLLGVDAHRDAVELAILARAKERRIRTLGVCRGAQLLAVANGGRLHQDLLAVGAQKHMPDSVEDPFAAIRHPITLKEGTLASTLFPHLTTVNSQHHQGIADPGSLTATAWSPDGVIEAIEGDDCFGVQWHPELCITEQPLHLKPFEWLVGKRMCA